MVFQKPSTILDIFSVFFLVTQTKTLRLTFLFVFLFLTLNAGMFFIWNTLPLKGITLAVIALIDIYLISLCQMILSRNIDSVIQYSEALNFNEIRTLITQKSIPLFIQPLLIFIFLLGALFISSIQALVLYIPYVGTFLYSLSYVIFFIIGVFFILNLILGFFSLQIIPTLVSERELKVIPIYKELCRIFYYSWPRLILLNLIQWGLTIFFFFYYRRVSFHRYLPHLKHHCLLQRFNPSARAHYSFLLLPRGRDHLGTL